MILSCRYGEPLVVPTIKEVKNFHSPKIIFLCETWNELKELRSVKNDLGMSNLFLVELRDKVMG